MQRIGKYKADEPMHSLITENYRTLPVLSRFGISLGFGDKTIGEVCVDNGVDIDMFLTIVNMMLDGDDTPPPPSSETSLMALVSYLHNSHDYFLGYRLPSIREKLAETMEGDDSNLSRAIINYFDEYVAEVQEHMTYEERNLFPYVSVLLEGKIKPDYSVDIFRKQHDKVEARLTEFKQILIKYYPAQSTNEINSVLFDIFNCENDLAFHNDIEDRLFVPAVMALEKKRSGKKK